MNIVRRELKTSWISILVWSLAFFLFSFAGIMKYDSLLMTGGEILALLEQFPRVLLALFNMVDVDLSTLPGYFTIIANYFLLMCGSHGMFLGIRLFAKEEQDKTADFLLTKPRSRTHVFLNKVSAGVVIVVILQMILFLCNGYALRNHLPDAWEMLFHYSVVFFVVHLLFLSLGVGLINAIPRAKAENVGLLILLMNYFIPVLANMTESLYIIKEFFPFNMFLHEEMAEVGGLPLIKLIILFIIMVLLLLLGQRSFAKRDILL